MNTRICLVMFVCAAGASCVVACYPQRLSPACQARISECLARCEPGEQAPGDPEDRSALFSVDQRSQCEHRCHEMCGGAEARRRVPPAPDPQKVLGPEGER